MSGQLVLAIDQGTTSSRAIVYDGGGNRVGISQKAIEASFRQPGWVEQDAVEIWETTRRVVEGAIAAAGLVPSDIASIGITNQRETTILWDRATGEPVAPAVVWQSRQSSEVVDGITRRGLGERYQAVTGLVPDAYFSATKIAWLLGVHPELRSRAEAGEIAFGTVETWLIWKLTGGRRHVTDVSNASRTMLLDLEALDWSAELLEDLAIPAALLPEIVPTVGSDLVTSADVIGAEIPISGSAGDQQAALFGQGCFRPGMAKNTYGTGSFLLLNTGTNRPRSSHRLLSTVAWSVGGETTYALEGAVFVTGSAVQWLRDGLGIIRSADEIEPLAHSVPDSGGVTVVPALSGLGAPDWDAAARGTILGITRGTTRAHIARATLEAIAFQIRDVVEAMNADVSPALGELRVDGGASANDLLMQLQADVLGVPVVRPAEIETTASGAAMLARLGLNPLRPLDDLITGRAPDRTFEPAMTDDERASRYRTWRRAVDRSRGWAEG